MLAFVLYNFFVVFLSCCCLFTFLDSVWFTSMFYAIVEFLVCYESALSNYSGTLVARSQNWIDLGGLLDWLISYPTIILSTVVVSCGDDLDTSSFVDRLFL